MERRLAAIFAADVVGYSRLMGTNEVGTLNMLKAHRAELIDELIATHGGRIVKLTGDGMLVEFSSAVEAVLCAAEIQHGMYLRNVDVPEDRRMTFRIGINLGDIIFEDGDIFGNGVNLAARIESIAKPGGVAVSAAVYDDVHAKVDLSFDDTGDHMLKNIAAPTRVFDIALGLPMLGYGSGGIAAPFAAIKPSIAVLPFSNMSNDAEQDYFSDGITEDVITDLSKISALFVVGRNNSFVYKGRVVDRAEVARELGVKFLLEGSVRKAGERVRISAQLIDGHSGLQLWSDRYDRNLTDIFAIQDEITTTIVEQLKVRLLPNEKSAVALAPTANVEAYTYYLRGRQFFRMGTKAFLLLARRMFATAAELDPRYAHAYTGMANCDSLLNAWHGVAISEEDILALTDKALAIDPELAEAYAARGVAFASSEQRAEATAAFERALTLDPNCHEANYLYAKFCFTSGDLERAARLFIRSLEILPDDYFAPLVLQSVFHSLGRTQEAELYARLGLKRAEEALRLHPEASDPAQLGAATLAALGEKDRARDWLVRALAIDPDDNNARYNAACTYALLDEPDKAIDLLQILLPQVGSHLQNWFQTDPDLESIRNHPRYQGLLAELT